MVRPDPHRHAELFRPQHQRTKRLLEPLDLRLVLRVGVLADSELLAVGVVAGVHADLLDVLDGLHRGARREVDVGDEGHADLSSGERAANFGKVARIGRGRDRHADDLAAGLHHADDLRDCRRRVGRRGRRHRLDADRIAPSDPDVADHDLARGSPPVLVGRLAPGSDHRPEL